MINRKNPVGSFVDERELTRWSLFEREECFFLLRGIVKMGIGNGIDVGQSQ